MAHFINIPSDPNVPTVERARTPAVEHAYHALQLGFIAAPLIAGADTVGAFALSPLASAREARA